MLEGLFTVLYTETLTENMTLEQPYAVCTAVWAATGLYSSWYRSSGCTPNSLLWIVFSSAPSQPSSARPAPEVSLSLLFFLLIPKAALCSSPDLRGSTPFCCSDWAELGSSKRVLSSQGTCLCSSPSSQLSQITTTRLFIPLDLHKALVGHLYPLL